MISIIMIKQLNLISSIHNILSQNEFYFSLCCLTNFNLVSLCRFSRIGVFFGFRDFKQFLRISLLIVRLIILHRYERKSSCSSSRVPIVFWLIRLPKFLDNLREIFLGRPILFCFQQCYTFHPCNE